VCVMHICFVRAFCECVMDLCTPVGSVSSHSALASFPEAQNGKSKYFFFFVVSHDC
jgi:hypothetical protein